MTFPGGDSSCQCARVGVAGAGGSLAVVSLIPGVRVSTQASGGAPLRMVTDAKPMPVRSKLREEAAFLLPTDGATIAERVCLPSGHPHAHPQTISRVGTLREGLSLPEGWNVGEGLIKSLVGAWPR